MNLSKRTLPIVKWPGGKSRMLKLILPLIQARPHVCYCEAFAGGLAVLMAKLRSKVEVINDINGDLVALYRNLQFHLMALIDEIDWLFASRKNLKDFVAQPGLTELQRAARFLARNRTSFGGKGDSFGVAKTAGGGVGLDRHRVGNLLGGAHERLNGVVIEQLSYERCLNNYDSTNTLHFLDPPYVDAPTDLYPVWTQAEMKRFRRQIEKLRGDFIITVNDSPANRDLFSDCQVTPVRNQNRLRNNAGPSAQFGELIISNN